MQQRPLHMQQRPLHFRTDEFSFAALSSPTAVWSDPICFVPGRVNLNGCRSSFNLSVAPSFFLPSYPHLLTL